MRDQVNQNILSDNKSEYEILCEKWWQWLLNIPKDRNPANDKHGEDCAQGQNDNGAPDVWFLAGSTGYHPVTRNCKVPPNKKLFFPLICQEISYSEYPQYSTETQLRQTATDAMDHVEALELTVGGTQIERSQIPRVQSSLFPVNLAIDNIFGAQAGPTETVSDGYWIHLPALKSDKAEIRFKAEAFFVGFENNKEAKYGQDVTYNLTISK
jgi:hypothetical protein